MKQRASSVLGVSVCLKGDLKRRTTDLAICPNDIRAKSWSWRGVAMMLRGVVFLRSEREDGTLISFGLEILGRTRSYGIRCRWPMHCLPWCISRKAAAVRASTFSPPRSYSSHRFPDRPTDRPRSKVLHPSVRGTFGRGRERNERAIAFAEQQMDGWIGLARRVLRHRQSISQISFA